MFIELTDHLRCPAGHEEAYLVLLPSALEGRQVLGGVLGCPVCHAEYPVTDGEVSFGPAINARPADLPVEAAHAFLGLAGPGGYVLLVGGAAALAAGLAERLPGVRLVLVNPPDPVGAVDTASVLRAPHLPVKTGSMRGAVISADHAADRSWLEATIGAVLPGLRVVGEGPVPALPGLEISAEGGGWWVGRRG